MELAGQAYQRWLQGTREKQTGVKKLCWWRTGNDTRYYHPQEWVGPLDNAIMEKVEDKKVENERTRLNITFRVHSHCIR